LNKKKPPKDESPAHSAQQNTLPLPYCYTSPARESVIDSLFSARSASPVARLPEEPLASEVQALLNSATNVIECTTGGHARCVHSDCRCDCHKPSEPSLETVISVRLAQPVDEESK
jgi:hypothetical protein